MHPHHHHYSLATMWPLYLMLLYGIIGMGYLFTHFGALSHSWLEWSEGSKMKFRAPRAIQNMSFVGLSFPATVMLPSAIHSHFPLSLFVYGSALSFFLLGVCVAGPNDTLIDGEQGTYQKTGGWPWFPKTRSGSLNEFEAVSVTPNNSVSLLFKRRKQRRWTDGFVLEMATSRQGAVAMAERVSQISGLPIRV